MASEHLLLLPGMMCDERLWRDQLRDLEIECTVPSLTGASDMTAIARNVLADAPPTFALAGLSMGGIVALEIMRQEPQRVTHLALIDTNPFADTASKQSVRMQQIEVALNGGLRELATEALKPLYLARSKRDDEALLNTILQMALDLGPEVFESQSLALRNRADSSNRLSSINVPTSVMCGAEDQLCPVEYHEFMAARIPDAKLVVIHDCGHLSSMEQPDIVTRELRELLRRHTVEEKIYADQH